jgi:hypothetical protein
MMKRLMLGPRPGYSTEQLEELADYIAERIDECMSMFVFVGVDESMDVPVAWFSAADSFEDGRKALQIAKELIEDFEFGRK